MKIIFMGTPDFAVASLKAIVEAGLDVVGVLTMPDKPAGRGYQLQASAVKIYALEKGLFLMQPSNLKDPNFIEELRSLQADIQVVVAFRMLPELVWDMPPLGTFNLHASLLPQYRGAAPINWAIMNGETQTGITTFFLSHEIDTGRVIDRVTVDIDPLDNAGSVHDKLMLLGAKLVLKTLFSIEQGGVETLSQEEMINADSILSLAPKLNKDNCRINWDKEALHIHNQIRGLSPYPGAWCEIVSPQAKLSPVKIWSSTLLSEESESEIGSCLSDEKNYLEIVCGQGKIAVQEIQVPGKKRMGIKDFLRGNSIDINWKAL